MIREYIQAALSTAQFEPVEDSGQIYGRVPACPGVWATGETQEECSRTLEEVLESWILLGVRLGDQLPEIHGKRIEIPETVPVSD